MAGERFTPEFLDRVITATDTAAVIGRYTTLKRRGKSLIGLCPFHQEKTPSFTVDPENGLFYCFGCHAGGSVFQFLMNKEGYSLPEAVEVLAREAGIELPAKSGASKSSPGLLDAADFTARFFRKAIESDFGKEANDYLKARGISNKTSADFLIGWAPLDQTHLARSIKKSQLDPEPFTQIGVIAKSKTDGRLFATISGSLVIPIIGTGGKVIAFAHRKIKETEQSGPKYVNSADNDIYHKSSVLFGLPQARSSIRKEEFTILVEGYFDVMALAEHGIANVVATCGTALTQQQASLMLRYAPKVVVLFDGDSAGLKATLRSLEILLGVGLNVYIVRLPGEEDPDSFVRKEGAEKLKHSISNAQGWFDWFFDFSKSDAKLDGVQGALAVADSFANLISAIPGAPERGLFTTELAKRLGSSEQRIAERISQTNSKTRRETQFASQPAKLPELPDEQKLELVLLAEILRGTSRESAENPLFHFPGLWEKACNGADPAVILSDIGDTRAQCCLSELLITSDSSDPNEHYQKSFRKVLITSVEKKIAKINSEITITEKAKDKIRLIELIKELQFLEAKRNTIRKEINRGV
jgi:DNA primase